MPVLGNDVNQCMMCKHLKKVGVHFNRGGQGWRCAAFGDQDIPDEIVMGRFDHRGEYFSINDSPHDHGIQFEDSGKEPYTFEQLAGPYNPEYEDT